MRKTRAATQSQRAIGHIAALQFIATMFVMHAMVGRSTLQFKMPRLTAHPNARAAPEGKAASWSRRVGRLSVLRTPIGAKALIAGANALNPLNCYLFCNNKPYTNKR
jgi:hypothetical protein